MTDQLYYPFKSKWLGQWVKARYMCTRDELEKRFAPGEYEFIGNSGSPPGFGHGLSVCVLAHPADAFALRA